MLKSEQLPALGNLQNLCDSVAAKYRDFLLIFLYGFLVHSLSRKRMHFSEIPNVQYACQAKLPVSGRPLLGIKLGFVPVS